MCARCVESWQGKNDGDYYDNIKIIGVGGGGCKAIEHMISDRDMVKRPVGMATFSAIDTDAEALSRSSAATKLLLGDTFIHGRGCAGNPTLGYEAAATEREAMRTLLTDTGTLFIVTSLGGGTGSGAAPVLAEIACELNIPTVAVVTQPCSFEGKQRTNYATVGQIKLHQQVPTIVIPNDQCLSDGVTPLGAFAAANDRQVEAIRALAELINPDVTMICIELFEVINLMNMDLPCNLGIGFSSGENRAREAAKKAMTELELRNSDSGSKYKYNGVFFNIASDTYFTFEEFEVAYNLFKDFLPEDATLIGGQYFDPRIKDGVRITAIDSCSRVYEVCE